MEKPLALKLMGNRSLDIYPVALDEMVIRELKLTGKGVGPTILVADDAVAICQTPTVLVDRAKITAVNDADHLQAILVITPNLSPAERSADTAPSEGDSQFLTETRQFAPDLLNLAENILRQIRSRGVGGKLVKKEKGRWINQPINSFTLKVQPRANNIQFTIYGNHWTFEDAEFLKKDQNSYSRGWVKNHSEVERFVNLVSESHSRRV